jgi:hypothetical protein
MNFKNGALIAIAAGSLFAAACKKADEKTMDKAGEMKPEGDMAKPEGDMAKPAGDMAKPAGDMAKPAGDMMAGEKTAKVHCMGINECKGKGACKTEANACAGHNGCGKKGFVEVTEDECKTKGGTVMAKK